VGRDYIIIFSTYLHVADISLLTYWNFEMFFIYRSILKMFKCSMDQQKSGMWFKKRHKPQKILF